MAKLKKLKLVEGILCGQYTLPENKLINIELYLEDDDPRSDDFTELMLQSEKWLNNLNKEIEEELKKSISQELTDAAYAESDYKPVAKDYADLKADLQFHLIRFFPDAVISITLEAKNIYRDMHIYCQINSAFEIEDLFLDKIADENV